MPCCSGNNSVALQTAGHSVKIAQSRCSVVWSRIVQVRPEVRGFSSLMFINRNQVETHTDDETEEQKDHKVHTHTVLSAL